MEAGFPQDHTARKEVLVTQNTALSLSLHYPTDGREKKQEMEGEKEEGRQERGKGRKREKEREGGRERRKKLRE